MRAAQKSMWQSKRWRSPYYWAGFLIQGEWKKTKATITASDEYSPLKSVKDPAEAQ